jgi:hypothetical protein
VNSEIAQAVTLYTLGRYADAKMALRFALSMGPARDSMRCTLGPILAPENRYTTEALTLLRESGRTFLLRSH